MTNVIRVATATKNDPIKVEKPADAALSPGHLLIANATGEFLKHNAAGVGGLVFVADLNMHDGLDTAYATGDTVQAYQPLSGEVYQVRAATGQALVKDVTTLTSDGSGRVKVGVVGTDTIIGYAAATVTTSANEQLVMVKFQ